MCKKSRLRLDWRFAFLFMCNLLVWYTGGKTYQEVIMTNKTVIDALKQIKTYCAADLLEKLNYAIDIIEKLEKDGVKDPLATDFTALSQAKAGK